MQKKIRNTTPLCFKTYNKQSASSIPYLSPFSPLMLQDEKLTKALIHTRFVKSEVAWRVPQEVVVKETLCKLKSHRKFLKPENQGSIFFLRLWIM